jgi:hypothetical protein
MYKILRGSCRCSTSGPIKVILKLLYYDLPMEEERRNSQTTRGKKKLKMKAPNFQWDSIEMDESSDASEARHLAVPFRGIDKEFNIIE